MSRPFMISGGRISGFSALFCAFALNQIPGLDPWFYEPVNSQFGYFAVHNHIYIIIDPVAGVAVQMPNDQQKF